MDIFGSISNAINDMVVKPIVDAFGGVADWAGQIPAMAANAVTSALATVAGPIAGAIGNGLKAVPSMLIGGIRSIISAFFATIKQVVFG